MLLYSQPFSYKRADCEVLTKIYSFILCQCTCWWMFMLLILNLWLMH